MIAAGIDLGGTKIEAQVFDSGWNRVETHRIATPTTYDDLVQAMVSLIDWIESKSQGLPIGIAAAGLIHPTTGLALTANLPATGRPFPADIAKAAGRAVIYINDCRAQTLSEARFGAAKGFRTAVSLNLGTGLAGGIAAHIVAQYDLPIIRCGCGRLGCTETLIAGPGLTRIHHHLTGKTLTPEAITKDRSSQTWAVWCQLTAEVIHTLCMTVDPDCIVLAGGLSRADGLIPDLGTALTRAQLPGYAAPLLRLAEGGDTTGARGAAYAAATARKNA